MFHKVKASDFLKALLAVWDLTLSNAETIGAQLTQYTEEEYATMCLFLSSDKLTGFGIKEGDELVNLFNLGRQIDGTVAVRYAINCGARRLDCFDGFLSAYYARLGFVEVRREPNWTPGGADVVWMELPPLPATPYNPHFPFANAEPKHWIEQAA